MKKKIGIVILLFLVIVFGCFSNVFAADNSDGAEIGINNLNNTIENSAKVGDKLTHPEIGWKRYDNVDNKIYYNGTWINDSNSPEVEDYNNTGIATLKVGDNVNFKFYGTKLRIIALTCRPASSYHSSGYNAVIDGIDKGNISCISNSSPVTGPYNNSGSVLTYEVTGLNNGIHTVKLTCADKSLFSSCNRDCFEFDAIDIDDTGYLVDTSAILATGISLDKTSLDIKKGDTSTLTVTVTPDNASNKSVTWKSSDDSIVSVDKNGKITALKAGTATVTAVTQDGSNLSASCTVNVTEKTSPTNPTNPTGSGDKATLNITMTNGQVKQYNVTMDVVNKFISWYKLRSAGSGDPFSIFDITQASQSDIKRTDYVVFDKISSFEVDDYIK